MLNRDQIIARIKEVIADLDRLSGMPKGLSFNDKTILMISRQETCRVLKELLEIIEDKRSTEIKTKHELVP